MEENTEDRVRIDISEPDYSQPYDQLYEQTFDGCREDYNMHLQCIKCAISNVQLKIREYRQDHEMIRAAISQGAKFRPDCFDPLYWEDEIEHLQGYINFLTDKKKRLVKSTRELYANEKYTYLELMGLFQTDVWRGMMQNAPSEDRERLISEILGCDIDNARHIMNGRNSLKEKKKEELQDRVNRLSKGA